MEILIWSTVYLNLVVGLLVLVVSLAGVGWIFWFAGKNRFRPKPWAEHQITALGDE